MVLPVPDHPRPIPTIPGPSPAHPRPSRPSLPIPGPSPDCAHCSDRDSVYDAVLAVPDRVIEGRPEVVGYFCHPVTSLAMDYAAAAQGPV